MRGRSLSLSAPHRRAAARADPPAADAPAAGAARRYRAHHSPCLGAAAAARAVAEVSAAAVEVVAQASAAMAAMAAMADAAAAAAAPAADAAEAAEAAFAAPQQRARSEVWREARDPPTRDSTTDEPPPHTERPERAAAASGSSRATPCPLPDGGLIFALFTTGHFYLFFFVFWWPAGNLRLPRFDAQGEAAKSRRRGVSRSFSRSPSSRCTPRGGASAGGGERAGPRTLYSPRPPPRALSNTPRHLRKPSPSGVAEVAARRWRARHR